MTIEYGPEFMLYPCRECFQPIRAHGDFECIPNNRGAADFYHLGCAPSASPERSVEP